VKVAYNACFGGFSLSAKASTEYARRKGITLTFYKQTKYKHSGGSDEYVRDEMLAPNEIMLVVGKDAYESIKKSGQLEVDSDER
jgi:hypothetical protein